MTYLVKKQEKNSKEALEKRYFNNPIQAKMYEEALANSLVNFGKYTKKSTYNNGCTKTTYFFNNLTNRVMKVIFMIID